MIAKRIVYGHDDSHDTSVCQFGKTVVTMTEKTGNKALSPLFQNVVREDPYECLPLLLGEKWKDDQYYLDVDERAKENGKSGNTYKPDFARFFDDFDGSWSVTEAKVDSDNIDFLDENVGTHEKPRPIYVFRLADVRSGGTVREESVHWCGGVASFCRERALTEIRQRLRKEVLNSPVYSEILEPGFCSRNQRMEYLAKRCFHPYRYNSGLYEDFAVRYMGSSGEHDVNSVYLMMLSIIEDYAVFVPENISCDNIPLWGIPSPTYPMVGEDRFYTTSYSKITLDRKAVGMREALCSNSWCADPFADPFAEG